MISSRSSLAASLVVTLIAGYQRFISPYKGFHCAYRLRHGGAGCSEFARQAIREQGLWRGWRMIRQRFRDCALAAQQQRNVESEGQSSNGMSAQAAKHCLGSGCDLSSVACSGCGGGCST
ncbi:MAG: membrane protein insertion efficiency factor YidD [Planctomycetes bacterium]|nr:membrane protein insertion efficiency factor YidD [Planctomycetota bacterium]